jgi:hypothetical protein
MSDHYPPDMGHSTKGAPWNEPELLEDEDPTMWEKPDPDDDGDQAYDQMKDDQLERDTLDQMADFAHDSAREQQLMGGQRFARD